MQTTRKENQWTIFTCAACLSALAVCFMQSFIQLIISIAFLYAPSTTIRHGPHIVTNGCEVANKWRCICRASIYVASGILLQQQQWFVPTTALEEIGNKRDYDRLQRALMMRNLSLLYGENWPAANSQFAVAEDLDTACKRHLIREPPLPSLSDWEKFPVQQHQPFPILPSSRIKHVNVTVYHR